MKNLFLTLALVFTTGTVLNASTLEIVSGDCTADAWEFGTGWDGGDSESEYYWTNRYFEHFCNDDGSYK